MSASRPIRTEPRDHSITTKVTGKDLLVNASQVNAHALTWVYL